MGNGAKAQQKRERNAKAASKGPTSQAKTNQAALTIICEKCRQSFLMTTRLPALVEHAQNKHDLAVHVCFPSTAGDK